MTLINKLAQNALASSNIDKTLFDTYNVKRGLRNADFSGVLVGLTNIGDVVGYQRVEDKLEPRHGELYYRGIEIRDLVKGFQSNGRNGFEETAFLLLSGKLPNQEELTQFSDYIEAEAELPPHFANSLILRIGLLILFALAVFSRSLDAELLMKEPAITSCCIPQCWGGWLCVGETSCGYSVLRSPHLGNYSMSRSPAASAGTIPGVSGRRGTRRQCSR